MADTSPIYDHMEGFGIKGHMLGRKLGIIQEVMVYKYLTSIPKIRERLVYNMSPVAFSEARHFVEFCICSLQSRGEAGAGQRKNVQTVTRSRNLYATGASRFLAGPFWFVCGIPSSGLN